MLLFGMPMDAIFIGIIIFVVLCIIFKKGFLIPLIGGTAIFVFGLYFFVTALDHLSGIEGALGQFTEHNGNWATTKNVSLIFMVIGGILILLGIIFAIKSGNKKTQNTYNYYGAAGGSTVICSGCGKMIPAGTKFCPDCGSPVNTVPAGQFNLGSEAPTSGDDINNTADTQPEVKKEAKPVNRHVCPNCGAKRSASEKFCGKCGTKFE